MPRPSRPVEKSARQAPAPIRRHGAVGGDSGANTAAIATSDEPAKILKICAHLPPYMAQSQEGEPDPFRQLLPGALLPQQRHLHQTRPTHRDAGEPRKGHPVVRGDKRLWLMERMQDSYPYCHPF